MEITNRETNMDEGQAKELGKLLRTKREELGLSTRQVGQTADVNQTTVVRLEQGQYLNPDPDKLRAVAETLDLNLTDVLLMAAYPVTTELPSVGPYLRTKFRNLPAHELEALQQEVAQVLRQHGIGPGDGPTDGEDEQPEEARPNS